MGSLFRSEAIDKCNLYLETDCAYRCVAELGELGYLQFIDLNPSTNATLRKYVNEIRRCEELERKIRFILGEAVNEKIEVPSDENLNPPVPPISAIAEIEIKMEKMEEQMRQSSSNIATLKDNYSSLVEVCHVLKNAKVVFQLCNFGSNRENSNLSFIAATVLQDKVPSMQRLLFFACRNFVYAKIIPIEGEFEDPKTKTKVLKSVIFVFFQGDQLKIKVRKILEGFRATIYPCPDNEAEAETLVTGVSQRIEDMSRVLEESNAFRTIQLKSMVNELPSWLVQIKKVKSVFYVLNGFDVDTAHRYMVGECWCPLVHFDEIRQSLLTATKSSNSAPSAAIFSVIDSNGHIPPSYHRTNKFTRVFQSVVNAYGISTYEEVNPAPFIIISFPFLFSVMFGDAGHGLLLLLAGLALVVFENRLGGRSDNEIWNIFFSGRYIILLMGIFSIYSGMIYNDIFAKPFNIFGSAWNVDPKKYHHVLEHESSLTLNPLTFDNVSDYRGHPYSFGMDPIWQMAINKITWSNSFKMKISISFGISQMFFGVILSAFNHWHFRSALNVFCEFVPEMLFLMAMFGYLVILIFYKWIAIDATKSACSPSLLINLINMFLISYKDEPCMPTNFYPNQKSFQIFLLLVVVVCIPWLLLPKPLIMRYQHKKTAQKMVDIRGNSSRNSFGKIEMEEVESSRDSHQNVRESRPDPNARGEHEGEFNFGDVFIHQCIHTIEFCLGCISHTASYLRLWALSLAHAQLSEVLWFMILRTALQINGGGGSIVIFFLFAPWAFLTVAILLLMEGLSAFLHTLRLHWVEFQSKFYKGEGHKFSPFSFKKMLSKSLED